jgi:hypothetical protein
MRKHVHIYIQISSDGKCHHASARCCYKKYKLKPFVSNLLSPISNYTQTPMYCVDLKPKCELACNSLYVNLIILLTLIVVVNKISLDTNNASILFLYL